MFECYPNLQYTWTITRALIERFVENLPNRKTVRIERSERQRSTCTHDPVLLIPEYFQVAKFYDFKP